jgi:hypothetical protein
MTSKVRSSKVVFLEGTRKLAPRPNFQNVLHKQGSKSTPEVKFPRASQGRVPNIHPGLCTGNYRNAKLEISDWTTAGAYDEEEESEAESEDM